MLSQPNIMQNLNAPDQFMRQSPAIKFGAKGLLALVALLALTSAGQPLRTIAATPTPATPIAQTPMTAEKLLRYGNRKLAERDHEGAIADFDQAIKLAPNDANAYKQRGKAHQEFALFSNDTKQEYQRAIADFDQAIKLAPNDADAYKRRGDARKAFGDEAGAAVDYAQAEKLQPTVPEPKTAQQFFDRAQDAIYARKYEAAIADLDQVIRMNSNVAPAYFLRGGSYAAIGNARLAEQDFGDAIRLKPDYAQAYAHRATLRYRTNDYTGAIADFEQVIKLKPDYADAKSGLALARATVEKEAKMSAVDFNIRGREKTRQQDYQGAIADFNQAIKLKPSGFAFYANRGVAYNAIGVASNAIRERKLALADFDQAIKLKPDSALYYRYRAGVRSALGDKPGTIADYQKAAELYQNDNDPKNRQEMLDQIKKLQP
jgi:tetratricopeptide (TPR) repeat protein